MGLFALYNMQMVIFECLFEKNPENLLLIN